MSGAKCPNCSANITCGCQRRVASDGKSVCTNCQAIYEKKLAEKKAAATQNR